MSSLASERVVVFVLFAACLLVSVAGTGQAAAPVPGFGPPPGILAGTWWKLSVSAKGYRVDSAGATSKDSVHTTAWMRIDHFDLPGPPTDASFNNALYTYAMYTETAAGVFENTASEHFFVVGLDEELHETLAVNTLMKFPLGNETLAGRVTARLKLKLKNGALAGATLKTIAGELEQSTLDAAASETFWGELAISGRTVPADSLPFTP